MENGKEMSVRPGFMNPASVKEGMELAQWIAKSDLAPKDYKDKPQNVLIAMQMGLEVGLSPMQAIQNIAVINGRPSIWGDSMLAICQAHRDFESNDENESDDKQGVCVVKRRGMEAQRRVFTIDDAKRAGLWGKQGPWQTAPARMLKLRARAFALRDTFADALRGLSSAEEMKDFVETSAASPAAPAMSMPQRLEKAPDKESTTNEGTVTIAEVKKFTDGHFEVTDTEGVCYSTTDEELAVALKEAKGQMRTIFFVAVDGQMPRLTAAFCPEKKA